MKRLTKVPRGRTPRGNPYEQDFGAGMSAPGHLLLEMRGPSGLIIKPPSRDRYEPREWLPHDGSFKSFITARLVKAMQPTAFDEDMRPATPEAVSRALRLLVSISKPSSVYPSIVPDGDGGISIAWIAGKQMLVIDIEADGQSGYARATNSAGQTILNFEFGRDVASKRLGQALDRLSARVSSVNPHWRNLYA